MRIDPKQKWYPFYLAQPFYNLLLMGFFEWGVASHDLDFEAIRSGKKSKQQLRDELKAMGVKARRQIIKDYIAFPALSGRKHWKKTFWANFTANIVRNLWSHAIIFCGHFPDQAYTFTEDEVADETRGGFYVRQLLGAANIEGGPAFHVMSGNLGYQVEHHLFPDIPSSRYAEIAPRVKAVCEKYELPYNSGPLLQQWLMVQRSIIRLAFPGGEERPKPGPYRGEPAEHAQNGHGSSNGHVPEAAVPAFP
jgi:Fatty acid desaturase